MAPPTTKTGTAAAEAWIDSLDEPRRSEVRHLHEVIRAAIPDADVVVMDYTGPVVGYGTYDVLDLQGTRRPVVLGRACQPEGIHLAVHDGYGRGGYVAEQAQDRLPGTKVGKSCINIRKPALVDDAVVADLARRSWHQFRAA